MATRFQAATLVASPSYPNSIAWSEDNLLAVATGHIVTILSPALPSGPRGLIILPPSRPFPIGVIKREDLLSGCLLPTCLSRDCRPSVRSLSWSPLGLAPNYGCLLALCTTEGRVKLYRFPFCEFSAHWIELVDITDMLLDYLASINFGELNGSPHSIREKENELGVVPESEADLPITVLKKGHKRRRLDDMGRVKKGFGGSEPRFLARCNSGVVTTSSTHTNKPFTCCLQEKILSISNLQELSPVEVLRLDGSHRVWVPGILSYCTRVKALAAFTELDGKQDGKVEIDLQYDENHDDFPKVRPSMNFGNLPEELANCHGWEKFLSIGHAVEVWTNDRWVEGLFMGFDKTHLLVKFHGDPDFVPLSPNYVRSAPVWIKERKSWKVIVVKMVMERRKFPEVPDLNVLAESVNHFQTPPMHNSKLKPHEKIQENCSSLKITADEYASRTALLSSLVVCWLPMQQFSLDRGPKTSSTSANCCSLLAVGGKSGIISFWRINGPCCYSVEQSMIKNTAMLVGLLDAHDAWITAVDCASIVTDALGSRVLLATGGADGSVKVWIGSGEGLLESSKVNYAPFSLFSEISATGSIPVSVLSLVGPVQHRDNVVIAIGRGSGTFDVWACNLSTSRFDERGSFDAHDRIV